MSDKPWSEKNAWSAFRNLAPKVSELVNGKPKDGKAGAAEKRKKREKSPVPKEDGRRKRSTGRTAIFNTKLKPEFRAELFELAAKQDIAVAALLEKIVEEWKAFKRGRP
jgi:hypothetical protein